MHSNAEIDDTIHFEISPERIFRAKCDPEWELLGKLWQKVS